MFSTRRFARNKRKTVAGRRPRVVRPLEQLEMRTLLAASAPSKLVVNTVADSGAGSLRAAITYSNQHGGNDEIDFNIPGVATHHILLDSPLPAITAPVTIDGFGVKPTTPNNNTVPNTLGPNQGTNLKPYVELDSTSRTPVTIGLDIASGGGGTTIRGLAVEGFTEQAILIQSGVSGVRIAGDSIGVGYPFPNTSGPQLSETGVGIEVDGIRNTIGGLTDGDRTLISGAKNQGVLIHGNGNTVLNSLIGTNPTGDKKNGNGSQGIFILGSNNTIGGGTLGTQNVISGNGTNGVDIYGANGKAVTGNRVIGNYLGVGAGGENALGNNNAGVVVNDADSTTLASNVIAGNNPSRNSTYAGIVIGSPGVTGASGNTLVTGNLIGLFPNGKTALGDGNAGILVQQTIGTTIGGSTAAAGNVISGNLGDGIVVGPQGTVTKVLGNYIGMAADGRTPKGNTGNGVRVFHGRASIGSSIPNTGNIISGNGGAGVLIDNGDDVSIMNNTIGLAADGATKAGNGRQGIFLTSDSGSTIKDNVISSNSSHGIDVFESSGEVITGNAIGVNANGTASANNPLGNGGIGVLVHQSSGVVVGGESAGAGNLISGNAGGGVDVRQSSITRVAGNQVGTGFAGTGAIGNANYGIQVENGSSGTTIGGTTAAAGNVISGNNGNGVNISASTETLVAGNFVGTDVSGKLALANQGSGIQVENGSSGTTIGGAGNGASNLISGNKGSGVELVNGATAILVTHNLIGVGADGTSAVGNHGFGVYVHRGRGAPSSGNTIGGTTAGAGNVIGFNKEGVVIGDSLTDNSQRNAILGNAIYKSSVLIDLGKTDSASYKPSGTSGPNLLEVVPRLTTATVSGSDLMIKGMLNATLPSTKYRLEFFAAGPNVGPFKRFLGFFDVTTGSRGNVPGGFSIVLKGLAVPRGTLVSATATDQNGNTTGFAVGIATK